MSKKPAFRFRDPCCHAWTEGHARRALSLYFRVPAQQDDGEGARRCLDQGAVLPAALDRALRRVWPVACRECRDRPGACDGHPRADGRARPARRRMRALAPEPDALQPVVCACLFTVISTTTARRSAIARSGASPLARSVL